MRHVFACCGLLAALLCPASRAPAQDASASAADLALPAGIATHADGRRPIGSLYAAYAGLLKRGWSLDIVTRSQPEGTDAALPVIALRSPVTGPAVWILSGIHGEEPAGPNAIARAIDDIARLGARRPVVLLPLLNPHGYARNWRYLNVAVYSPAIDGDSVGDSSHLLPQPEAAGRARSPAPSSPEAGAITTYVLARSADYPPLASIDLHEDNLIDQGYVYSQGVAGAADPLAIAAVGVLRAHGIPLKLDGETRFGEPIAGGIIGPVTDSSIDELMSAATVIAGGCPRPGPAAPTVLVFETPAAALSLDRRIEAHAALLRRLAARLMDAAVAE